jgi:Phage gp6-like head-tail connector protein
VALGDLTTLADVKAWLQTGQSAFPTTDDALLSRLVTAASRYIQAWLCRQIALEDYVETRDGTGGQSLQFACFPVSAVLSLTIDDQAIPQAASSMADGYSFSRTQLSVRGYRFTRRLRTS